MLSVFMPNVVAPSLDLRKLGKKTHSGYRCCPDLPVLPVGLELENLLDVVCDDLLRPVLPGCQRFFRRSHLGIFVLKLHCWPILQKCYDRK